MDLKPLAFVGKAVEHRVFYVAKFEDAVYVLHAFEKKRQKTSERDLELGRARLSELLAQRPRNQG